MIIDCISDLHGHFPKLEGGDLLIVAGDLTATHDIRELHEFNEWIREQKYSKKILIAGNHDTFFERGVFDCYNPIDGTVFVDPSVDYLCDSGTEFEGLKIWGSPWSLWFHGINPNCKAFTGSERTLAKKWALIPDDIDILITHSPPYGILDKTCRNQHVGSIHLRNMVLDCGRFPRLKLHVFGHIHEQGGKTIKTTFTTFVNASHVNERYEPVNKPVRVIL